MIDINTRIFDIPNFEQLLEKEIKKMYAFYGMSEDKANECVYFLKRHFEQTRYYEKQYNWGNVLYMLKEIEKLEEKTLKPKYFINALNTVKFSTYQQGDKKDERPAKDKLVELYKILMEKYNNNQSEFRQKYKNLAALFVDKSVNIGKDVNNILKSKEL